MNLSLPKPKSLTSSQKHNLIALIIGGLATLNEHWPQVVFLIGQHYHGLPVPPGVTLSIQVTALVITSLSRALNRAKSGTGTGIVGGAPDHAAEDAVATGTDGGNAGTDGGNTPAAPLTLPVLEKQVGSILATDVLDYAKSRLTGLPLQRVVAGAAQAVADVEAEKVASMTNMTGFLPGELAAAPPVAPTSQASQSSPASPAAAPPGLPAVPPAVVNTGGAQIVTPPAPETAFVDGASEPMPSPLPGELAPPAAVPVAGVSQE